MSIAIALIFEYIFALNFNLYKSVWWCTGVCMDRHLATSLLTAHLIPASDAAPRRGRLRSANRNCLTVPRCRLGTYAWLSGVRLRHPDSLELDT